MTSRENGVIQLPLPPQTGLAVSNKGTVETRLRYMREGSILLALVRFVALRDH